MRFYIEIGIVNRIFGLYLLKLYRMGQLMVQGLSEVAHKYRLPENSSYDQKKIYISFVTALIRKIQVFKTI